MITPDPDWWRDAVVYQIYIRSFADGDGDGIGDIAGLRANLPHLADLGVDALWINPWYPSPMADGGYDVADYRAIEPLFGTLEQGKAMITEAHDLGLRVLLDVVPNHTSDQHEWFAAALAAGPGSPERERYIFRPGKGPDGAEPPSNWQSVFGGSAWQRVTEADGTPGEWYLHLFAPEQPDLDWRHPEVQADFETTLRFWFDLGVDGFRIDVAHALAKDTTFPDLATAIAEEEDDAATVAVAATAEVPAPGTHPFWDREEVHAVYRRWRAIADAYDPPRTFVAEAWVETPSRLARYVRSDELHTAFNFAFLDARFLAADLREAIQTSLSALEPVAAPGTWTLSNHDVCRHPSRYGRPQAEVEGHSLDHVIRLPLDLELGRRRARAAALLLLALPGSVYLYQGEELGLEEVEDLPEEALQDPTWLRTGHTLRGRDGCRVPLPWSGEAPPFGFSPPGAADPWLPQPAGWADRTAAAQRDDPDSFLALYRDALHLRRANDGFGDVSLTWVKDDPEVLAFTRSSDLLCVVNLSGGSVALPEDGDLLLASGPLDEDGQLPPDTAAWVQI